MALGPTEDEAVHPRLGEAGEVLLQRRHQGQRQGDGAPAGVARRWAGAQAGSRLDQDLGDGHGSMQQIEMPPGQSHKLAPAAAGQRRGKDQGRIAGLDGGGELIDLGDGRNRSLRAVLPAGTPYGAGIGD